MVISGMENQEESSMGTSDSSPVMRLQEEPGVAYPLNRMVSLYYESSMSEWLPPDMGQAELHAKHNIL